MVVASTRVRARGGGGEFGMLHQCLAMAMAMGWILAGGATRDARHIFRPKSYFGRLCACRAREKAQVV